MRTLVAAVSLCLLSACKLSLDATLAPLDCSSRENQRGSSCSGNHGSVVVIVILSSHQYSDPADALCYQVSPVAASVTVGGSYYFQNNTSSTITIQGSNQATWVTVGAGEASAALSLSAAGDYNFGVQGCRGVSGTAWYGVLHVTSG